MSSIEFLCSSCQRTLKAPLGTEGKRTRCPSCNTPAQVPFCPIPVATAIPLAHNKVFDMLGGFVKSVRNSKEPWYYGYCYRMTLVILCMFLFGIAVQAVIWFGFQAFTIAALSVPNHHSSRFDPDYDYSPPSETEKNFGAVVILAITNIMYVFWVVFVVLWILYIFGIVLIFIDSARWMRRYCCHALKQASEA
jgi:LSD1 subclass zinc finger protein